MSSEQNTTVRLRVPADQIAAAIGLLDRAGEVLAESAKRRHPRVRFTLPSPLLMSCRRVDRVAVYEIAARNLSAHGLGGLVGGFIHPGSECWLTVPTSTGEQVKVEGTVKWCRHVSKSIHEIGIQSAEPIDLSRFVAQSALGGKAEVSARSSDLHLFLRKHASQLLLHSRNEASLSDIKKTVRDIQRLIDREEAARSPWTQ